MEVLLPMNFAGMSPLMNVNHKKQTHLKKLEGVRSGKSMYYIGTTYNVQDIKNDSYFIVIYQKAENQEI